MFNAVYKNKTVLITGNTGFKGSWLTLWLLKLGANVVGISDEIPTKPSLFNALKIEDKKQKKIELDKKKLLEQAIIFEKNKQFQQYSIIYYNKIKLNSIISEQ